MKKDDLSINKNTLIKWFVESSEKNSAFIERVADVLEELNDQNKVHSRRIEENNKLILENNIVLRDMVELSKGYIGKIWIMVLLIVFTMIVLVIGDKVKLFNNLLKFF